MDLKQLSDFDLETSFKRVVRTERKITHVVLRYILEVESRKLHLQKGFDSMLKYLTREMGYSENCAYSRMQAARVLKQVPEVAEKIEAGSINLSQLIQVQKCIREKVSEGKPVSASQTLEVLNHIENRTSYETNKVLAKEFDLPTQFRELITPQKDDSVRVEITFTQEQFVEIRKAKEYLSHICPDGNLSEVIGTLARKFNRAKEGKVSAENSTVGRASKEIASEQDAAKCKKVGRNIDSGSESKVGIEEEKFAKPKAAPSGRIEFPEITTQSFTKAVKPARPYLSVHLKRELLRKANHCCEYRDSRTGILCGSKFQLQIDHVEPLALGGGHGSENLRVLCRTHNLFMAAKAGLLRPA